MANHDLSATYLAAPISVGIKPIADRRREILLRDRELFGSQSLPFVAVDQTHLSPSDLITAECAKIVFCIGGWGRIATSTEVMRLEPGSVAIIPPGLPCSGAPLGQSRTITAYIQRDYLRTNLRWLSAHHPVVHGLRRSLEAPHELGRLHIADDARPGLVRRLNRLTHFAGEQRQEFALLASAADLFDYLGHSAGTRHSRDSATGTLPSQEVSSAIALMEADISHSWSIDEIAQEVSMSASQLSRLFRRDLGISPAAYLSRARVDRMAELLSTTRVDIASAAQSSGWSNPTVAARAFKRRFGVTPSAFASAYRHERAPRIRAS